MDTLGLLGQAIECSICLEQLDISSRVLPCQHTFCTSCLLDIISSHKELRCPECRALVTVPFDSLKPNIILMRILEGMKQFPQTSAVKNQHVRDSACLQLLEEDHAKPQSDSSNFFSCDSVSDIKLLNRPKPSLTIQTAAAESTGIHSPFHIVTQSNNFTQSFASNSMCTNSMQYVSLASPVSNSSMVAETFVNLTSQTTPITSVFQPSVSLFQTSNLASHSPKTTLNNIARPLPCTSDISVNISEYDKAGQQINASSSAERSRKVVSSASLTGTPVQSTIKSSFCNVPVSVNESQEFAQNRPISHYDLLTSFSNSHPNPESSINFQSLVTQLNVQAKALFSYDKQEERDLSFKKGSVISICKQIDDNWLYGELNNQFGFVPMSYVTLLEPLPSHVPQCKALYDFKINMQEEKNCLTFNKGDTMTVLRRVDDNWAEGKLNTRIGIFPLSFVRLNDSAKTLLKISNSESSATSCSANNSPPLPSLNFRKDINTLVTTSTPIASKLSSSILTPLPSSAIHSDGTTGANSKEGSVVKLESNKRHSSTDLLQHSQSSNSSSPANTHRSFDVGLDNATENSKNVTKSNGSQEQNSDGISAQLHPDSAEKLNSLHLYVALYSYRPRKADELELRKGYLYSVSDKCQDGWCKGRCLSTDKIGVFPGNYVHPAKAQTISAFLSRCSPNILPSSPFRTTVPGSNSTSSSLNRSSSAKSSTVSSNTRPFSSVASNPFSGADVRLITGSPTIPPELPPRHITSTNTSSLNVIDNVRNSSRVEVGSSSSTNPDQSSVSPQSEKKYSKERGNLSSGGYSLIKKLTNAKKAPHASIENSVFEESGNGSDSSKLSQFKSDNLSSPESNGSPKFSKHPVPLFIERFRCIAPFPPNGNNELELKIGDVVYVHKKGQDGWYKGTLQRTGKTGLFPASFVESC